MLQTTGSSLDSTPAENRRSILFDVARSLSALYIVGFHHVLDYSPWLRSHVDPVWNGAVKTGCLAFFFFCSSYLVSRRHEIRSRSDAFGFYRRRCLRILPLYLLALVSFSRPLSLTLASTIGLNNFLPDIDGKNIPTLWFVSQLLVFYAIYPPLSRLRNQPVVLVAICMALELVLWNGAVRFGWDRRLWWYFPMYAGGMLLSNWDEQRLLAASAVSSAAFLALCISGMALDWPILVAASGCGCVLAFSKLLAGLPGMTFVARPIAYASMNAYLFHRKEYHRLVLAFNVLFGQDARNGSAFLLWMYLVCVPSAFILGWLIQRVYDRLVSATFQSALSFFPPWRRGL